MKQVLVVGNDVAVCDSYNQWRFAVTEATIQHERLYGGQQPYGTWADRVSRTIKRYHGGGMSNVFKGPENPAAIY